MTDAQIAALMGWSEEHMSRNDGPKSLEARVRALVAAAVAAEREARQEAQRRLEALQERINHADKEKAQAVDAERISAANVCLEMAERMERAAGICASNGEADEVSPLRSTAWQLTVAAELIKKGRASIFDAAIRGN